MAVKILDDSVAGNPQQALDFIVNILDSSTEYSIIAKDLEGAIVLWNEGARRLYGYEPDEVIGKANASILHTPEDIDAGVPRQILDATLRDGHWRGIINRLRKNGQRFSANVSVSVRRSPQGDPIGYLLISNDASNLNLIKEELLASERKYRRLFEAAKDGILILDAVTGMVMDVNPYLVNLLGYSHDNFLGKKVWELGFLKDVIANEFNFLELQQKEYIRYDNMALETSEGRRIEVEFVSNVYLVNDRKVIQCNIRDITERKRAEEINRRLALAVEQASETIVITDNNGIIFYVNPAFEKTTGYTREEALGQNPRVLKSGKQNAEFYRELWGTLKRGEIWKGNFVNKRKDGTIYEEEATIAPIRDAGGATTSYVAVKRDMTREHSLERQFLQAQKMESIGRLAGGVAHDFNNILTAIIGYSNLLKPGLSDDPKLQNYASEIEKAGQRAATLTRQLLAFSRKQILQPQVLELNEVVSDLQKMLLRLIGEDIEVNTVLSPGLNHIKADPGQIEQVIINLCVNARDAMPQGGKLLISTSNVVVGAGFANVKGEVTPGDYVLLAITDTGSGMSADVQAHLFEPFYTTKKVGKGTGLGLATVFGIIKQSDGFINVYSELGHGTTFKIYLPSTTQKRETAALEVPVISLPQGTETILLVEDEPTLRELGHVILGEAG